MRLVLLALLAAACRAVPKDTSVDTGDVGGVDTADTADTADTDSGAPSPDADGDGVTVADGDCDDADGTVYPRAPERCDGVDQDCDGIIDEAAVDAPRWYDDDDGDGYGVEVLVACEQPEGFTAVGGDCDDGDPTIHPGAEESCTEDLDRNCDGVRTYADVDEDGTPACEDCDDLDPTAFPGAVEACDGADDDCDGLVDEDATDAVTWYADTDGDGFGDPGSSISACDAPAGYGADTADCDDGDPAVNPDATEVCDDGVDNDCDGVETLCARAYGPGSHDFRFEGVGRNDHLGWNVAVGDLDGDGVADLIGGAPFYSSPSSSTGAAAIWYGPLATDGPFDVAADAILTGTDGSDTVGMTLTVGDFDGDGFDDVFSYRRGVELNTMFLVYGGARRAGTTEMALVAEARFEGAYEADFGRYGATAAGDLDGDGADDLVVGAWGDDTAASGAGAAWVFFGSGARILGTTGTGDADAAFFGEADQHYVGLGVTIAPDIDGDGLDELLVNAAGDGADPPLYTSVYLVRGADILRGATEGISAGETVLTGVKHAGGAYSMAGLGDIDRDGYADIGLGDLRYDAVAGAVWLFGGGPGGVTPLTTIHGGAGEYFGSLHPLGDLDGDDVPELVVGASGYPRGGDEGRAYLFYGPLAGSVETTDAAALFYGEGSPYFGLSLPERGGDLTGDGIPDIVVGSPDDGGVGGIYVWAGFGGM